LSSLRAARDAASAKEMAGEGLQSGAQ